MIDLSKIRKYKITIYDPNGNPSTVYKYVNIETYQEIDESNILNQKVQEIEVNCSNFCSTKIAVDVETITPEKLFLDIFTPSSLAFSLRKLNTSYVGDAIEVRRSSDDSTLDIGFDLNGDLDTSALTTFVGAGDGFVSAWYDQSGFGNDATKIDNSLQPKIVDSGSVLTLNSKACIEFDGVDDFLQFNLATAIRSILLVGVSSGGVTDSYFMRDTLFFSGGLFVTNGDYSLPFLSTLDEHQFYGSLYVDSQNSILSATSQHLLYARRGGGLTTFTTIASNTNTTPIKVQEIIGYNTIQDSNRLLMEENINNYYNIY